MIIGVHTINYSKNAEANKVGLNGKLHKITSWLRCLETEKVKQDKSIVVI